MTAPISQIELPGIPKLKSGKVREVFDLGDAVLIVATDRLSAFDVILPDSIPERGRVLTALSEFWFKKTGHIVENHFITCDADKMVAQASRLRSLNSQLGRLRHHLENRSMLVRKCERRCPSNASSPAIWPADSYAPDKPQPSFDKQYVRDYLETLDWDKTTPGPKLPDNSVARLHTNHGRFKP